MTSEFVFFVLPSLPTPPGLVVHSWGLLVRRLNNGRKSSTKQDFPTAALKGWYLERPWYSYKWTVWEKCVTHPTKMLPAPAHNTYFSPLRTWHKLFFCCKPFVGKLGIIFRQRFPRVNKCDLTITWLSHSSMLGKSEPKRLSQMLVRNGDESQSVNKNHQIKHIQIEIGRESIKNLGKFHDVFPKIPWKQIQDHQLPHS